MLRRTVASFSIEQRRDELLVDKAATWTPPWKKADDRLTELLARLQSLDEERAAIAAEIEALRTKTIEDAPPSPAVLYQPSAAVDGRSPIQAKMGNPDDLFKTAR